jgi:hypothetical protein
MDSDVLAIVNRNYESFIAKQHVETGLVLGRCFKQNNIASSDTNFD